MIRVLLVDDDPLVRAGLRMMLDGAQDLSVVGEASDGSQVLDAVSRFGPDVVLMDIRMPALDGIAATQALRRRDDAPQVIVLTTFDADAQVLSALRAGAAGFLLKATAPADIVAAIRAVHAGDPILSPGVTRTLIQHVAAPASAESSRARAALADLSEREREVAQAVGRGLSNAEIAGELHLSPATVKAYVSRLLATLDLTNRVQLALLVHEADAAGSADAESL